ncbi:MAG: 4-hydroxythreonine-4-phosphate dehydrogenase PdxA [Chitinispirillaceae bacterium]|nr:4-hydroxythreonine-4-phosphate dehydrogenase PdxA [Chitinispirillaceae bacterium]
MPHEKSANAHRKSPLFALTMGDPAGIGPEIALKALQIPAFRESTVVVGDFGVMEDVAASLNLHLPLHPMASAGEFTTGSANILDCRQVTPGSYIIGRTHASCGRAAYAYIERAIRDALAGEVDGVITNPINKEALHAAGINYPGHTEIFAEKTGTAGYSMLFLLRNVGVAHVTTHCSLRDAIELVSVDRVASNIRLLDGAMRQLGVAAPRIAVGGLNPHAGENGLFGNEEIRHIAPAIETARREGVAATGPYPPDTVFMRAFRGEFDGVVAMLHDHGFVALKSMDFEHGVNITIGLPIIRTSVGHGTAFDIAGKGIASPESLLAAFDAALRLYRNRKQSG